MYNINNINTKLIKEVQKCIDLMNYKDKLFSIHRNIHYRTDIPILNN